MRKVISLADIVETTARVRGYPAGHQLFLIAERHVPSRGNEATVIDSLEHSFREYERIFQPSVYA